MIRLLALFLTPLVGLSAAHAQSAAPGADTVQVAINAITGLHFDRVRFQVQPGVPVKIVFRNAEQTDMQHNLVIVQPGARLQVATAGMQATAAENYVPALPEVLYQTPLLDAGSTAVLTFSAPTEPGAYPYLCTFPGHGFVMYGVMYVGMDMPPLASDENVPPTQRAGAASEASPSARGVSYGTTFPAISRTVLPESGPASIAVGFADGQSYDFDAGVSYLRYAWAGGFVDNTPPWKGNGNAFATVLGDVYYRSQVGFPFRVGNPDSIPDVVFRPGEVSDVHFLGYRLVDGGYPEFHYTVLGADVRELIEPRDGGRGLVRTFEISTEQPVWFVTDTGAGVEFQASAGKWQAGVLALTPGEARHFTLTMVPTASVTQ